MFPAGGEQMSEMEGRTVCFWVEECVLIAKYCTVLALALTDRPSTLAPIGGKSKIARHVISTTSVVPCTRCHWIEASIAGANKEIDVLPWRSCNGKNQLEACEFLLSRRHPSLHVGSPDRD
jgi:hypothetical protein